MKWTAVLPLKQGPERKSRLAERLSAECRVLLSDHMAKGVLALLGRCPSVERVIVLSPGPVPSGEWRRDGGKGLNAELASLRHSLGCPATLVMHGDLPLAKERDVEALVRAAEGHGVAMAPDRHGAGTNALAIAVAGPFPFAFGPDSRALHEVAGAAVVPLASLAIDVDTPADLDHAVGRGFRPPF